MKKEILKETREPGKLRKKKGQPKGRRNGFLEGLTGKDFTAAGLFFFSLLLLDISLLLFCVLLIQSIYFLLYFISQQSI